jgi:hypothetical protein
MEKVEETDAKNEGRLTKLKQIEELNYAKLEITSQLQRLKVMKSVRFFGFSLSHPHKQTLSLRSLQ